MGVNNKELLRLQKQLEELQKYDFDAFVRDATNEVAQRFYAKVVKRTPVGVYPEDSGKVGGTLRRGWRMTKVTKVADGYEVQIINPVEYASYVEYGHRQTPGRFVPAIGKRLKKSWVEGRFMMTKTEIEIEQDLPRIIENKLVKFLQDKIK